MRKPRLVILCLGAVALLDLGVYRSFHLYDRAKERTPNVMRKIQVLEREQRLIPFQESLYQELGNAYFEAGMNRLDDQNRPDSEFRKAYRFFARSLSLNPLSATAHFDFAQALRYMNFIDVPGEPTYLDEYKRAVLLTGYHPQIYPEVGKTLLSRWAALSADDRGFAVDVLAKVMARKNSDHIETLLQVWDLNVKDEQILEKILPPDAAVLRQVAQFFGEKSLSRETRIKFLSQAERLDFQTAKDESASGQSDLSAFKVKDAAAHFQAALQGLDSILFYQNLAGPKLIDALEFKNLLKSIHLGYGKCLLEESRRLESGLPHLYAYLDLEYQQSGVDELEAFLKERGMIEEKTGMSLKDFGRFAFELSLNFKQNRFKDIVVAGQALQKSFLAVPESAKADYGRVLELVGDAYQKLDFIYESNGFYQKVMDLALMRSDILIKMRKNYERLNDGDKVKAIDMSLAGLLAFKDARFSHVILNKGDSFDRNLPLNGNKIILALDFLESAVGPPPMISVVLNGQVTWEDYVTSPKIELPLFSQVGLNDIRITAVNRPAKLSNIAIVLDNSATQTGKGTAQARRPGD